MYQGRQGAGIRLGEGGQSYFHETNGTWETRTTKETEITVSIKGDAFNLQWIEEEKKGVRGPPSMAN